MNTFTKEQQYKIIEMYQNGIDIENIMCIFNSSERNIRCILKENSIDRKYNTFTQELQNRIIALYLNKYTQKKICDQLLVSEMGIRNILKRNGIPMRSYSECNRKYFLNENYFDIIDTQNKAYILGLLYADGCNSVKHHSITLSLQECDKHVIEFVKNELEYAGPIGFLELNKKNSNYQNQYKLCINNEYMSKRLEQLGVVTAKSLKLTFPEWIPDNLLSHFIRGYFDGDGCIYYDNKRSKCTTQTVGTRDFCDKLSNVLSSINCKHSIKHPKICHENTVIIQTGGNKSSLIFLSWLYQDAKFYMRRKYQKYLDFKEKYSSKIVA